MLGRFGQVSLRSAHATLYTAVVTSLVTTMHVIQRICHLTRVTLCTHWPFLCDLITASCLVLLLFVFMLQWLAAQAEAMHIIAILQPK